MCLQDKTARLSFSTHIFKTLKIAKHCLGTIKNEVKTVINVWGVPEQQIFPPLVPRSSPFWVAQGCRGGLHFWCEAGRVPRHLRYSPGLALWPVGAGAW